MIKLLRTALPIIFVMLLVTACMPALPPTSAVTSTPEAVPTDTASHELQMQSIEVQASNDYPGHVNAVVRGVLTESCTMLGESQVQYISYKFRITVYAVSRTDIGCAQITTPFEISIPLDTKDLPAGEYAVIANGVSTIFSLRVVNPTSTPASVITPTIALAVTPVEVNCIDAAKFLADVTIPDNSQLDANTPFTKTWRLKNTGTCTWDSTYLVAIISGIPMSQQPGYWIVPQGQTVAPGQTVDISVGMTSPVENGNYTSYWGLKKVDGPFIPVQGGVNGNSFYVKLQVGSGHGEGNVTAASIAIEPEQGSGPVCTVDSTYFVHAYLTADGPMTASYEISSTAGQIPAGYFQPSPMGPASIVVTGNMTFDQADTKEIGLRFVGPYPFPSDITVNLRVNGGEWHNTKLSCQ